MNFERIRKDYSENIDDTNENLNQPPKSFYEVMQEREAQERLESEKMKQSKKATMESLERITRTPSKPESRTSAPSNENEQGNHFSDIPESTEYGRTRVGSFADMMTERGRQLAKTPTPNEPDQTNTNPSQSQD